MQVRNELIISQYQNFTGQFKFKEHSAVRRCSLTVTVIQHCWLLRCRQSSANQRGYRQLMMPMMPTVEYYSS